MKYLFDKSYIDSRLQTRIYRQLQDWSYKSNNKILFLLLLLYRKFLDKSLVYQKKYQFYLKPIYKEKPKEDLTIDGYINKYGSIYNHGDGKTYTTKNSYLDALKRKGQHIKDYR